MSLAFMFESLIDAIADRIADRIEARDASLIDQNDKRGFMGRRHIEIVRARMAEKKHGAFKNGRDYCLTPAALREEMERGTIGGEAAPSVAVAPRPPARKGKSAAAARRAELEQLKRELQSDMNNARR